MFKIAAFLFPSLILFVSSANAAPATVTLTPDGVVRDIRQVHATFSEDMVALGQPNAEAPLVISCSPSEKGHPRWVDGRDWIFDFDRDLPRNTKCEAQVRAGLKTLSGRDVAATKFSFHTGEPVLSEVRPWEGSEVDPNQAFILTFDGEIDLPQVLAKTGLVVEGVQNQIPMASLSGGDVKTLMASRELAGFKEKLGKTVFVLQPKSTLPEGKSVRLTWKGSEKTFNFAVLQALTADFTCERENANSPCNPVGHSTLRFSANIPVKDLAQIRLRQGTQVVIPFKAEKLNPNESRGAVELPRPLSANSTYEIELPKELVDESGRKLANAKSFPLTFKTADYPPLVKFAADFGILEAANPVLPVTVRAVEPNIKTDILNVKTLKVVAAEKQGLVDFISYVRSITQIMGRTDSQANQSVLMGADRAHAQVSQLPKPSGAKEFEVMGIPLKGPGFYVVEIESRILGDSLIPYTDPQTHKVTPTRPMFVSTAVLVTDLAVHFKQGRERSLVWVTQLSTGQPVPAADVAIVGCDGKELFKGVTDNSGLVFATKIPWVPKSCPGANFSIMAVAHKGEDQSFVLDSWSQGIEPFRYNLPVDYASSATEESSVVHSVLSRSLLRAGETLHMKHFLREANLNGFRLPGLKEGPKKLVVSHVGSDEKFEFDLKFDAKGIALTELPIPKQAKVGTYQIYYEWPKVGGRWPISLPGPNFRVEEFRLPVLKAVIQGPSEALVRATNIPLQLSLNYLSGGAAANEKVTLRYQFKEDREVTFPNYDEFVFARSKVKPSIARGEEESEPNEANDSSDAGPVNSVADAYRTLPLTLDKAGAASANLRNDLKMDRPGTLNAEMEYHDPNGAVETSAASFQLWNADLVVGLAPGSWSTTKDDAKIQVVVLDLKGQPQSNVPVSIDSFSRKSYSYRKRLVGGFFAFETFTEVKKLGRYCEGKTDSRGLLVCEKPVQQTGELIFEASVKDKRGNIATSNRSIYVYDKDELWFDPANNDRMDLLTDAKSIAPDQKAKLQVRMPFRSATTLVTVEREGVLDAFVTQLSGDHPEIEVPMKDSYAPNVFISALAVRGRVADPAATALVDLGKPSFKLGLVPIKVGWAAHELKVQASTDRPVYQTRDHARVHIHVQTPKGAPASGEVAVAVVDEALLELKPNDSWKLLAAMMRERSYSVRTFTAQLNVIGKRHFGKKALPAGGGGGRGATRELFDTLVLWQPRVTLNAKGEADLDVPLNDSISKFRVAVIADSGAQLFGTGDTTFTTTKDLQILPGAPPLMRAGDQMIVHATVRNTTTEPLKAKVKLECESLEISQAEKSIDLAPQSSVDVTWPLTVTAGRAETNVVFNVEAGSLHDATRIKIPILKPIPVRTIQATLLQVPASGTLSIPVDSPPAAIPGEGGVRLSLASHLGESVQPVIDFMTNYPYTCLEQRTSRAIVLNDTTAWKEIVATMPSFLDANGLLKYWASSEYGSDVLSSYILAITSEAGWKIPEPVLEKIKTGLQAFAEGKIRDPWDGTGLASQTQAFELRKLAALEALSRYGVNDESALASLHITPQTWPSSAVIDWWTLLQRWKGVKDHDVKLAEAERILRSRLDFRGTRLGFSTEKTDLWTSLMISPDLNAARLMLTALHEASWKGDLPRLIRGMLDRRKLGTWLNTTANAWNLVALRKFSAEYEKTAVTGETSASLAGQQKQLSWKEAKSGVLDFTWPKSASKMEVKQQGTGQPWVTVEARAAIPLKAPENSGLKVERTLTPIQQRTPGIWSRGDVARVTLKFEAQTDSSWVVLEDPIPAGATILGSGLGRDSALLSSHEKSNGAWLTFVERKNDVYRAYYEYVTKGTSTVEYTLRFNQSGRFELPPTHLEAMYAPDIFANTPNATIEVKE